MRRLKCPNGVKMSERLSKARSLRALSLGLTSLRISEIVVIRTVSFPR